MESNVADNPVPWEVTALFPGERLILRETKRAVTPFGGVAVFVSYLRKVGFMGRVRQCMTATDDRQTRQPPVRPETRRWRTELH